MYEMFFSGSIDVSQPVSNLANTTAGQTDVIAQSLALREEMRAKAEKMDMAAKNMAKEVERLKRELQHVTFERDAWRSDSKRLDIQVQRLRAQQNSVDSPEESAASTNSMTPSDSSSSMDRQCLEDFRFSSDRVTSSTMCPSAVMKNGKLQNKGDERKQFRSQPLPAFSHTSTLRCPAATSSAKCSPQRADSEASKSSRLSPCDDGRRLRGDITGIGDSKLHAALDHHMLPVQSSRCRRENRDRSRPAQVGGQKTEISSTTTASLSCDRQDRNYLQPTENDMDMNAKSKMHSPIAVNSHKCSVTGKEACEQQTSKTHRVPSTLRALKRPRTSSSDSPQEMSMKRKENNSKIDVEVEKQNSARLPWHKPTSPQPQTLSQAKILAPDESDNEFTERSRSRRSSSVYRSSRGGARKNKIPSVFRSVIPWNSDANSSISPLLSTPSSCSLRRKRNEYGVDKITDAEVPKRIKSPTHEWSDSKERRGRSLSPRARSPVVRLTTDTKWARRGSRYFGEREVTESVRRDVSVSSWSRPHNYSRRSGTPRSRH
ncbi:hypothetical protein AB6A40_003583 [Gnathostoma spinigerum]|uniref:Uncharacterized protein n=1 Tax=Gnathostoma spinigerum TaxID=75299 RepID=A0ABD6E9Z8_9BILA